MSREWQAQAAEENYPSGEVWTQEENVVSCYFSLSLSVSHLFFFFQMCSALKIHPNDVHIFNHASIKKIGNRKKQCN